LMHERFSDRARRTLALANQEAIRLHHESLAPAHILLGLLGMSSSLAVTAMKNLDINLDALREDLNRRLEPGSRQLQQTKMAQSAETRQVIQYAIEEARKLGHKYVGSEHLLLGILREGNNIAAKALTEKGLKLEQLREELLLILRSSTDEAHT